jgi:hypothetical protein
VRYERSSDVKDVGDSSVSYASAFAILWSGRAGCHAIRLGRDTIVAASH